MFPATVIIYPLLSQPHIAIFVAFVLIALCNTLTSTSLLPRLSRIVRWLSPSFLFVLAFFTPAFRHLHRLLGLPVTPLCHTYWVQYLGGYIYIALGFGFGLSNVRQPESRFKINGIVFLTIFGTFVLLNLFLIIALRCDLIRETWSPR
jgi:hypothetical protein